MGVSVSNQTKILCNIVNNGNYLKKYMQNLKISFLSKELFVIVIREQ